MAQTFYLIFIPFAILAFWLWRTNRKIDQANDSVSRLKKDLELAHRERELLHGKIRQLGTVDLDVAVIQNQAEENNELMVSFVEQKINELDSNMEELEEEIKEVLEDMEARIASLETAAEEYEEVATPNGDEVIRSK